MKHLLLLLGLGLTLTANAQDSKVDLNINSTQDITIKEGLHPWNTKKLVQVEKWAVQTKTYFHKKKSKINKKIAKAMFNNKDASKYINKLDWLIAEEARQLKDLNRRFDIIANPLGN